MLTCLGYLVLFIAVLSRDIRLQQFLSFGSRDSEFSFDRIFCEELTWCARISGELFGLLITKIIIFFAQIFYGNPDWQQFYISQKEYFTIYYKLSSILFRILCILPTCLYLRKILKDSILGHFFSLLCISSILSGFPLYYLNNLLYLLKI